MIQPLGNRILVKRLDMARHTSTLLVIPDTVDTDRPSQFGLVIAIGTKFREAVKPGDVVVLKDFVGSPVFVRLDGPDGNLTECSIVPEDGVLMVIEGMGL